MTAFKPGQSPPPVRIPIRLATHAEGGNRTHTGLAAHRILSPARLPVPPLRLGSKSIGALPQTLSGSARPRSCRASRPFSERKEGAHGGNPVSPVLLKVAATGRCPDTCPHEAGSGSQPEPVCKRDIVRATEEEES